MISKNNMMYLLCLIAVVACVASQAGGPAPSADPQSLAGEPALPGDISKSKENVETLLDQLTSPREAERFRAMKKLKTQLERIRVKNVEHALTSLRKKNVSTLIFLLMEAGSDVLYGIGLPARRAAENSEGSFPNIAFYYARVTPRKGLPELYRLYGKHREQRLAICKAIGETGDSGALKFLMAEAKAEKMAGASAFPFIAGLQSSDRTMSRDAIEWFLEQDLDREEIILLSRLRTSLDQSELVSFYDKGEKKKIYATEHIFRKPDIYFEALCSVIDKELENRQYDKVRQMMMSDSIRRCRDQRVRQYRETVLRRIENPDH